MTNKRYTSVFDLEGKDLESFIKKYGDIFEPKYVDFDYYKLYYLGKFDPMIHIFNYLAQTYKIDKVVYPGSFIHLAPSYSFSHVTYIDLFDNIEDFFVDRDVLKYIDLHKIYEESTKIEFYHQSYTEMEGQYELMISSNAGSVSIDCKHLIKLGGFLLANNGHNDADNAFADDSYTYLGCFKFTGDKEHVSFVIDGQSKKSDTYYLFRLEK